MSEDNLRDAKVVAIKLPFFNILEIVFKVTIAGFVMLLPIFLFGVLFPELGNV
jgi:hypothetical protein|tara:strand:- start:19 stop:177 length:159 start_codon:yes stop_codon:yes gene_type:complete